MLLNNLVVLITTKNYAQSLRNFNPYKIFYQTNFHKMLKLTTYRELLKIKLNWI